MKKKNILIFEPYPFEQESGNLRTLSYILDFLDKDKFIVTVVSPFESAFNDKIRARGIECIVEVPPKLVSRYGRKVLKDGIFGKLATALALIPYNMRLNSIMRQKKIDLVYCNCIRAVLSVAMAAIFSRVPIVWYVKGRLENPTLDRIGFSICKKILFFCESNKNDKYPKTIKRYRNKIGILKIGLDKKRIEDVLCSTKLPKIRNEFKLTANDLHIAYLGQIYPKKGVNYLVEAFSSVCERIDNIRLFIVGDPILDDYRFFEDDLKQMIKVRGLENRVVFTGWRTDALEVIACMDILVHPSLEEGFGRAVLEAMALGKPVIATKVGGLRELIQDGVNGFLVDTQNSKQIEDKLQCLIADRQMREMFSERAKQTVFAEYLIEDKIKELEQIWLSVAN